MRIWQLPQNLLGLLLVLAYRAKTNEAGVYLSDKMTGGISCGNYIILRRWSKLSAAHERGHQVQSRRLGWLYLPVVGLSSVFHLVCRDGNIIWKKYSDYYSVWPESEADKLGGVKRDKNGRRYV